MEAGMDKTMNITTLTYFLLGSFFYQVPFNREPNVAWIVLGFFSAVGVLYAIRYVIYRLSGKTRYVQTEIESEYTQYDIGEG